MSTVFLINRNRNLVTRKLFILGSLVSKLKKENHVAREDIDLFRCGASARG